MLTATSRVLKQAFQNFFRNIWLSFVTLTILFLALSSINVLIILKVLAGTAVQSVQEKVDVTIYFKPEVPQDQVLNVQSFLTSQKGVKEVEYVSKDDALINFKAKHRDDPKILETLDELGDNPLGATLILTAHEPSDYQEILTLLEGDQFKNLIEDKNFADHRNVIDKITTVTDRVSVVVSVIAIVFTLISILIVFNAIKIAVYTHREEIRVMRLVGATGSFILAPYLIEALLFALFSLAVTIIVLFPVLGIIQPYVTTFFEGGEFNILSYFNQNFITIFGLEFLCVAAITVISALLAGKKYIKN